MKETEHDDPYVFAQPKESGIGFLYGKQAKDFLEHEKLSVKERIDAARSFIHEKLADQPNGLKKKELEELEERLIGASLKIPVTSLLKKKPQNFEGPILIGRTSPEPIEKDGVVGRPASRLAPWVHQARFESVWPKVWSSWSNERRKTEHYRWPTKFNLLNRALGKKAGEEYDLEYKIMPEHLVLIPQKDFQFSLNFGSNKLSGISSVDRDERTQTLNDLLAAQGYGPEITKNWHYVFWATRESKDGSFSFNAAEWLDFFGYKRTGGGRNRKPRHPSSSVRTARRSFNTFASIEMYGTLCGSPVKGQILHNKRLELTELTESGGIKKHRYGVNEFLWGVLKSGLSYVLFSPQTVNAGGVHVDTNDKIIRILEVLYTHSRINATREKLVLSFKELAKQTNMYTAKTDPKKARKDLWKKMEIAQSQGRLMKIQKTELKNGLPGFSYELPEEQKQNMMRVAKLREKLSGTKIS